MQNEGIDREKESTRVPKYLEVERRGMEEGGKRSRSRSLINGIANGVYVEESSRRTERSRINKSIMVCTPPP